MNWLRLLFLLGLCCVSTLTACTPGMGTPTPVMLGDNTDAVTDGDGDGLPDTIDPCPGLKFNAATDPMVALNMPCATAFDCYDMVVDGKWRNGTARPTIDFPATKVNGFAPAYCISGQCQMMRDTDKSGGADACDPDDDNDGVLDTEDNCPLVENGPLAPLHPATGVMLENQLDTDGDGLGNACDPDDDNDGVPDERDNCQFAANADQLDTDHSCVDVGANPHDCGDACSGDSDGDGVPNERDNCPLNSNTDQADFDHDGLGDACDDDIDGDGDPNSTDCNDLDPAIWLGAHEICDGIDNNCDGLVDEGFPNTDGTDGADCMDVDDDGDGVLDTVDNCPLVPNSDQANADNDTYATDAAGVVIAGGDACDPDDDNDGVLDAADKCPLHPNADQIDTDNDGLGDVCDPSCEGDTDYDRPEFVGLPLDEELPSNLTNATCLPTYLDWDEDGYCPVGKDLNQDYDCLDAGEVGSTILGDCNDGAAGINPEATERCDGVDNDCDGSTDEGGDPALCPGGGTCETILSETKCRYPDTCVPQCNGKVCGDNGCGGQCGACTAPATCSAAGQCTAPAPQCVADADCDDHDAATTNHCSNGSCSYTPVCVPQCQGKVCGPDNCGGFCSPNACQAGQSCDATGQCVAAPQAGELRVTYAVDASLLPAGTEARLQMECTGGDSLAWSPWLKKVAPLPTSGTLQMEYKTRLAALDHCKVNVAVVIGGTPEDPTFEYMALCRNGCRGRGTVSYTYFGAVTYSVASVGIEDNGQGGRDWGFRPGTDTDGDGVLDAADTDDDGDGVLDAADRAPTDSTVH